MARWGTRFTNSATGSVQIDDQYANMALSSKTTQTTGTAITYGASSISTTTFTYTKTELPLVAIACQSPAFVAWVVRNDGANTWTFTIKVEGASKAVTCYEFGEPTNQGAGWGMRIKRGGVVKYDSRNQYARIYTSLRGTYDTSSAGGSAGPSSSLASGRTYAALIGSTTGAFIQSTAPAGTGGLDYQVGQFSYSLGVAINGSSLTSKYLQTMRNVTYFPVPPSPPPPSSWNNSQTQYSWAVLDVTGY